MPRFTILSPPNECGRNLGRVADELVAGYDNIKVDPEDLEITDPQGAPRTEWDALFNFICERNIEGLILTPFADRGMIRAPYLLAVVRKAEVKLGRQVKVVIATRGGMRLNRIGLLSPTPRSSLLLISLTERDKRALARMIRRITVQRQGRYLMVDDLSTGQNFLSSVAERLNIIDQADICDFQRAYEFIRQRNYNPAILVTDVKDDYGYAVGLGMARTFAALRRYSDVPILFCSMRYPVISDLEYAARPVDAVVGLGSTRAAERINSVLRSPG